MDKNQAVTIVYTNYKGVTAIRRIIPISIFFGHTDWHKEDQWILNAFDLDKEAERGFAMKDIKSWFTN